VRRIVAPLLAAGLVFAAPAGARVPRRTAGYHVTVAGTTYSFFGSTGKYEPVERFRHQGSLWVDPLNRSGTRRSAGLFVGRPVITAVAGAIQFATNSFSFRHRPGYGPFTSSRLSIANVRVRGSRLRASVVELRARQATAELFQTRSERIIGSPTQILRGSLRLDFSRRAGTVKGAIVVYGNKLIEPGNTFPVEAYSARIAGRRTR
jgi:hypothetical protein